MTSAAASLEPGARANAPSVVLVETTLATLGTWDQSSLTMIFWLFESKTLRTGLAKVPGSPKAARVGPTARTRRVFALFPRTVMPGITTLAPVPTLARAERLTRPLNSTETEAGALVAVPEGLVATQVKSPA